MNTASGFSDPLVSDTPLPFHELCARIHDRIATFLDAKDVSDRVKNVQQQTRTSLDVIGRALEQYRLVMTAHVGHCGRVRLTAAAVYQSSHCRGMVGRIVSCSWSCIYARYTRRA
jgi:FAD synthetase